MRRTLILIVAMGFYLLIGKSVFSQDSNKGLDKIVDFPSPFNAINQKDTTSEGWFTKQTEKYLQRHSIREKKLQKKFSKIDSTTAKQRFANRIAMRTMSLLT